MCIYRIKIKGKYYCGKRIPLECKPEVCPFGIRHWQVLVKRDQGDREKHYWVCKKSGEVERIEDAEEAVKKVKQGEGNYVCRAVTYRFVGKRRKRRKMSSRPKEGTFEDGKRLTRWADVNLEGELGKGCEVAIIDSGASEDAPSEVKISLHESSIIDSEAHGEYIHQIIHDLIPESKVHIIQVLGEEIPDYLIISALEKCIDLRVHAVNLSIQGEEWSDGCDPLSLYVNYLAKQKKIPVIVAAGNGGPRLLSIGSPGAAKYAIAVGATDARGRLWKYSSRGPTLDGRFKPDLVAPGVFRYGDVPLKGTSFAAPWVTSAAAILNRDIGSALITRRILHLSARPIPVEYEKEKILVFRKKGKESQLVKKFLMIFSEAWPVILDPRNLHGAGLLDVKAAVEMRDELVSEIKMVG